MLLSAAIWLQNIGLMRALRESDRGYETLLALHVSCIALFAAMILLTDLRLLHLAPRGYSVSDIVDQLRVPKRIGFLCVAACGFLMFGMKAEEYYLNIFFRIKVLLFGMVAVHALVFRPRVYNRVADLEGSAAPPLRAKAAAALSLLLWFGIVCAGRGIGYIHPPPFSHHFVLAQATRTPLDSSGDDAANMLTSDSTHSLRNEKGAHNADH
jgi:hypothetical protein